MDAKLLVIITGIILVAAIIVLLLILRKGSGSYTIDTGGSVAPKATEGEGNTQGASWKGRFTGLSVGVGAIFAAIVAKLWSMQMVSSDYYEELSEQNQTRTVTTSAPRGRILDRNGEELVTNRASLAVTAYSDFADDTVCVRHLANVLGMPYVAVLRNIQDDTEGAQSTHTIASDVRRSTVAYIEEHISEFPGVEIAERTERSYPYGTLACHVLGYTGTVTTEQLEEQEEEEDEDDASAIEYESGDIVGQSGIEYYYERLLQGIRGEQTVKIDASGDVVSTGEEVPAEAGSDIKLTLDLEIQQSCEEALSDAVARGRSSGYTAVGGACICLDCTSGEILGMASYPTFDPAEFAGGISSDLWDELNSEDAGSPMLNRCVDGQYMSASTIKPFSALAGMEYGLYTSSDSTYCSGYWTGLGEDNGKYCWLHTGHGYMGIGSGIANSCDSVFYDIGKAFFYDDDNPEGLQEMFRRYGLGSTCGIDLPSESEGRVPDAEWKESYFSDWSESERTWNAGDMTNIVIGQGDILVTPLQMACAYAGLANGGVEYTPHLLLSAVARDGDGDAYTYEVNERLTADVASESDLEVVKQGLKEVITSNTSAAEYFANFPVEVCAKSGTGEKSGEDDYAWYCAFAPADEPQYVVVCMVEQGGGGGSIAMPAVREVLGTIYGVESAEDSTISDDTR